jgi:hypothetical protein
MIRPAVKWETPIRTLAIWVAACSLVHAADIRVAVQPQSARKPAPDFVLLNASSKSVSLSSFKGKPLLLAFGRRSAGAASKKFRRSSKFTALPTPTKALP